MLKPAFGAVSMLLTLLIIGIMAVMLLPMLKTTTSSLGGSSIQQESVQQKADEMIDSIEKSRQQTLDYYENMENY